MTPNPRAKLFMNIRSHLRRANLQFFERARERQFLLMMRGDALTVSQLITVRPDGVAFRIETRLPIVVPTHRRVAAAELVVTAAELVAATAAAELVATAAAELVATAAELAAATAAAELVATAAELAAAELQLLSTILRRLLVPLQPLYLQLQLHNLKDLQ